MLNRRGFFFSLSCASRGIFPPASVPFLWDCGPFLGRFFFGMFGFSFSFGSSWWLHLRECMPLWYSRIVSSHNRCTDVGEVKKK